MFANTSLAWPRFFGGAHMPKLRKINSCIMSTERKRLPKVFLAAGRGSLYRLMTLRSRRRRSATLVKLHASCLSRRARRAADTRPALSHLRLSVPRSGTCGASHSIRLGAAREADAMTLEEHRGMTAECAVRMSAQQFVAALDEALLAIPAMSRHGHVVGRYVDQETSGSVLDVVVVTIAGRFVVNARLHGDRNAISMTASSPAGVAVPLISAIRHRARRLAALTPIGDELVERVLVHEPRSPVDTLTAAVCSLIEMDGLTRVLAPTYSSASSTARFRTADGRSFLTSMVALNGILLVDALQVGADCHARARLPIRTFVNGQGALRNVTLLVSIVENSIARTMWRPMLPADTLTLPKHILSLCFAFLSARDLARVGTVSSPFGLIASDQRLWKVKR
ncbi:F-box domain-containing protein [Plasmodiophora brassicae]|uniref:F-box domain-containing protein n=1 Tax=Plasmodiophora brassicae TaxID=37360 RepID=A0A0G4J7C1_PLABS|nr:hypothetical protein PBRA_003014 [Plasmodiophora brassicae]